ncbi:hypothetical protein MMC25_001502 [Agyrium rufum]|nr:hypothetical protein [Agyrium rufum]
MDRPAFQVAIIGAGLSGLALALALHSQSINCSIYEGREAPLNVGGGPMLTPNGLKVLDKLGLYENLQNKGYSFDRLYLQDGNGGQITEVIEFGNMERYGTRALRVYRSVVLQELLAKVHEKSIPIHFGHKFTHVVSETEDEVTCHFTDGKTTIASLLVGADDIHSSVRDYLAPGLKPIFTSKASIIAAIPTAQLQLPETDLVNLNAPSNTHPLPVDITAPKAGAFVIAPQNSDGSEVLIAVQRHMTEATDGRWAELNADKPALTALFRQNAELFPPVVQNAVRDIPDAYLQIWPFYHIPRLERWTSARALGGFDRGVNQAFEDVYTFALVLGQLFATSPTPTPTNQRLQSALHSWQAFREARLDRVLELNRQMDLRRIPAATDASDETQDGKGPMDIDFDWLFRVDFDKAVMDCMEKVLA